MPKKLFVIFLLIVIAALSSVYFYSLYTSQKVVKGISSAAISYGDPLSWKGYEFKEVGLSLATPPELRVSGEKVDENTFTLYIERGSYPNSDYYQLYGIFHLGGIEANAADTVKRDLDQSFITQRAISGFNTIQGQYRGDRNRLVTYIFTDRGLFTLATSQPTYENGRLTDAILNTFQFFPTE